MRLIAEHKWRAAVGVVGLATVLAACTSDTSTGGEDTAVTQPALTGIQLVYCQVGTTCKRTTNLVCANDDGTVVPSCPDAGTADAGAPPPPPTLGWPSNPVLSGGNDMSLPGSGSVEPDGQYHYTLPLDAPPGRQGIGPHLALTYSSGAGDDLAGVGWTLGGQSAIAPCPKTQAHDGMSAPVILDGTDPLCLDGNRLIATGAGTYTTEQETYAQITSYADATRGGTVFKVQSQTGLTKIYRAYGPNPGSKANLIWLLDTVQDLDGNAMTYAYWDDSGFVPGINTQVGMWEFPLLSITYTGRVISTGITAGLRQVLFTYEGRPDIVSTRYGAVVQDPRCATNGAYCNTSGAIPMELRTSHRLKTVAMYGPRPGTGTSVVAPSLLWTYTLGYTPSAGTDRSLLTSVVKTGALGGESLTRIFGYDTASGLDSTRFAETGVQTQIPQIVGDFEHNGRTEAIRDYRPGGQLSNYVYRIDATGLTSLPSGVSALQYGVPSQVVDLNGDGVPEIVAPVLNQATLAGNAQTYQVLSLNTAGLPAAVNYNITDTGISYTDLADIPMGTAPNGSGPWTGPQPPSLLVFADLDGTGHVTGTYARHEPATDSTDWGCFIPPSAPPYAYGGCAFWDWATGPGANLTASSLNWYVQGNLTFGAGGPPSGKPAPADPWVMNGLGLGQYGQSFSWATATDGSGVGVVFAGIDVSATLRNPSAVVGPPLTNLKWWARTDRLVGLWGFDGSLQNYALDGSAYYIVDADANDKTGTHVWLALQNFETSAPLLGNFDGHAAAEHFDIEQSGLLPFAPSDTGQWTSQVMDYDGDGQSDVIAYYTVDCHDLASPQGCPSWLGSSGMPSTQTFISSAYLYHWGADGVLQGPTALSAIPLMIADFDGDGKSDMLGGTATELAAYQTANAGTKGGYFFQGGAKAHDWLNAVGDANAPPQEGIGYGYQQPSAQSYGACGSYPVACEAGGRLVVTSRMVFQGESIGAWDTHQFAYGPARYDVLGREFLGFDWIDDWHPSRPEETVTYYSNTTPLGVPFPGGVYQGFLPRFIVNTVPTSPVAGTSTSPTVHTTLSQHNYQLVQPLTSAYAIREASWATEELEGPASYSPAAASANVTAQPSFTNIGASWHFGAPSQPTLLKARTGSTSFDNYGNATYVFDHTVSGVAHAVSTVYYPPDTTHFLRSLPYSITTQSYNSGTTTPSARLTTFAYDSAHPALVQWKLDDVAPAPADPDVAVTTYFGRSADGVVTMVNRAVSKTINGTVTQEPVRSVTTVLDPDEGMFPRSVTTGGFNAPPQLTTQTLVNPVFGETQDTLDPNLIETRVVIDEFGRKRSAWNAAGTTLSTSYSPWASSIYPVIGTVITTQDAGGGMTVTQHDMWGRLINSQQLDFATTSAQSPVWDVQSSSYDVLGRVTFQSRPGVGTASTVGTQFTYDPMNRITQMITPDGGVVTRTNQYFQVAESMAVTQALGAPYTRTKVTNVDLDGRLSNVVENAPNGQYASLTYTYGDFDTLHAVVDSKGNTITNTYDLHGRKTQTIDPDTGTTSWTYNGFGDVVSETRINGTANLSTISSYDALGRATGTTYSDNTTATFTYDTAAHGLGQPAGSVSRDNVSESFTYDSWGRPYTTTWTLPTNQSFTMTQTYDGYGRPWNLQYPDVGTSTPVVVQTGYSSVTGAVTTIAEISSSKLLWSVSSRAADGQLLQGAYGNGDSETRTYWPSGRLNSSAVYGPAQATLLTDVGYTYNVDGNVASRHDPVRNRYECYGYDVLSRLSTWQLGTGSCTANGSLSASYAYDVLGNMTGVSQGNVGVVQVPYGETNTYGTNGAGPHALSSQSIGIFGSTRTFGYDGPGRQTTATGMSRTQVAYNDFDLPSSISSTSGATTTFLYDANGDRIQKSNTATGVTSVTLGGLFEMRATASTGATEYVLTTPATDGVSVQIDVTSGVESHTYLHPDGLGSVAVATADSGAVSAFMDYDPFGSRVSPQGTTLSGTFDVRAGFAGHEMDDDIGLINMKGRVYDPITRHFLSADPHVTYATATQNFNRYAYVLNNPLNLTDPTGLDIEGDVEAADVGGEANLQESLQAVDFEATLNPEAFEQNRTTVIIDSDPDHRNWQSLTIIEAEEDDPYADIPTIPTEHPQPTSPEDMKKLQELLQRDAVYWSRTKPTWLVNNHWYGPIPNKVPSKVTPQQPENLRDLVVTTPIDYNYPHPEPEIPGPGYRGSVWQIGIAGTAFGSLATAAGLPAGPGIGGSLEVGISIRGTKSGIPHLGLYATLSGIPGAGTPAEASLSVNVTRTPGSTGSIRGPGAMNVGCGGAGVALCGGFGSKDDAGNRAYTVGVGAGAGGMVGRQMGVTAATDPGAPY